MALKSGTIFKLADMICGQTNTSPEVFLTDCCLRSNVSSSTAMLRGSTKAHDIPADRQARHGGRRRIIFMDRDDLLRLSANADLPVPVPMRTGSPLDDEVPF